MSDSPLYELYSQCHSAVLQDHSRLTGRLLTLVDACFSDPQQRKAFKDLVAQEVEKSFQLNTRQELLTTFKRVGLLFESPLFEQGCDSDVDLRLVTTIKND